MIDENSFYTYSFVVKKLKFYDFQLFVKNSILTFENNNGNTHYFHYSVNKNYFNLHVYFYTYSITIICTNQKKKYFDGVPFKRVLFFP